jgi:hypothetical protein
MILFSIPVFSTVNSENQSDKEGFLNKERYIISLNDV